MSVEKVIVAEPLLWGGQGFAMFGAWHLLWLAICATVIALLVHSYRSLPADDSWHGGRRWLVLAAAIVPNALLLWGDVLKVQTGTFSPNWWPLHLCNIAEYICLWHALAPSRVTRELLLCFGLTGGLCAMLFPGWTYCPPYTLPCISGFMEHAFIFSVSLMALDDLHTAPRWRDAWISLVAAVLYLVFFRWFNGMFDTNFGFVTSPAVGSPLEWWERAFGNPGYLVPYMASFAVAVVLLHAWQERRRRREAPSKEGGCGVRSVAQLDILGDTPLARRMMAGSVALLAVGFVGAFFLVVADGWGTDVGAWFALSVVVTVVALPVHELVHAAAFLLLGRGRVRIRFGYEAGMLYTRAEGEPISRGRFLVVLLAPAVVVTAALVVAGELLAGPALAWALAWAHLSGCAGDLAMVWGIARTPGCTHVRDTATGVELLADDDGGDA